MFLVGSIQLTYAEKLEGIIENNSLTYSNIPEFELDYYSRWQVDENLDAKSVQFTINEGNMLATVNFKVNESNYPLTLEYMHQLITDDIESVGVIEEIKSKEILVQSIPGFEFTVSWSSGDIKVKQLFRTLVDKNQTYGFVFTTAAEHFEYYEQIRSDLLSSFKISENANYNWYIDSAHDFKMLYPKDWVKNESNDKEYELADFSSNSGSSVIILKYPNEDNLTLDEFVRGSFLDFNDLPITDLIEFEKTTLSNLDARSTLLKWDFLFVEMYMLVIGTLVNDDLYFVMFTSVAEHYESNLPIAKKMINSFEFTNPSLTMENTSSSIPSWIKNNAGWWADGILDDDSFISGIEYLTKEGILDVDQSAGSLPGSDDIPSWIKNNAGWWSQGLISDDDFVKGIQFLVENGIVTVN